MTDLSQLSNDQLMSLLSQHPDVAQPQDSSLGGIAMKMARPVLDAYMGNKGTVGGDIANQAGLTARYGVEGATALPNMMGNAANSVINTMLSDQDKLGMPSQTTSQLLTQSGLPQPQGAQQRIVGDASRALAGMGTSMGMASAVGDMAPALSPYVDAFNQNPMMQARAAVGSGGGSGSARELGFGPMGQAVAGLGGGLLATRTPFTESEPQPSLAKDLRSDASDAFKDASKTGAVFTEGASQQLPSDIESALATTGKMNARLHGDTQSVLDDLKDDAANKNLTLEDLHQYRQLFGQVVNNNLHPNGGLKPDAMKANQAIDAIDSMMESAKSNPSAYLKNSSPDAINSFQNGMDLWARSARVSDIERIMNRADMMEQPASSLRTGFRTLANNPTRLRGFSPEDQELIKKAATISMPVDVLRTLGSRLIGTIMAGSGKVGGSLVAQGGSSVARNLATQMQMNRGQSIINNIAQPNQLRQSMPDVSKYLGSLQGAYPELEYRQ